MTVLKLLVHGGWIIMSKVEQRKKGFTIGYLAGLCGMPLGIAPMFDVSNMCIYNNIALPNYSTVTDLYHRLAIMKHKSEDIYIIYDTMMGGFGVDSSNEVYFTTDTITTTSVSICPLGGRSWESVATLNYVEEREVNKNIRYYIGYFEDLVWTEEDIYYPNGI
jgi:hypothetical protein